MAQSAKTRATLLTRLNARTEVFVVKLRDETRTNPATLLPDDDLRVPVIPGIYLLDMCFIGRSSQAGEAININFSGPLGITDGGYGSFAQTGTSQRNAPGTGLETLQVFGVAGFTNANSYTNNSGWFAVRQAGDLVLNWTNNTIGGNYTLQRGSSIHLVRALNDGDT